MHEAAISKSINLVYKDAWNVVNLIMNQTLVIYFQDEAELNKKINMY